MRCAIPWATFAIPWATFAPGTKKELTTKKHFENSFTMLSRLFFDARFDSLHITDFLDLGSLWQLTQVSKKFQKIKHNVSIVDHNKVGYLFEDLTSNPEILFKFPFDYHKPIHMNVHHIFTLPQFSEKLVLRKFRGRSGAYSAKCGFEFLEFLRKSFTNVVVNLQTLTFHQESHPYSFISIDLMNVERCTNVHLVHFDKLRNVHTLNFEQCVFTEVFANHFPHPATRKLSFTNCDFKFPLEIFRIVPRNLQTLSFVNCTFSVPVHFNVMNAPYLREIVIENCPHIVVQEIVVQNKRKL